MYLNGYSVRIPEGSEKEASGYVEMEHDSQYTLQLRNSNTTRCDAEVNIDGKHVGTFRLDAHGSLRLERSADDERRFTFYLRDSDEGREVELTSVSKSELGLVQVVFKPERPKVIVKREPRPGIRRRSSDWDLPKGKLRSSDSSDCDCLGLDNYMLGGESTSKGLDSMHRSNFVGSEYSASYSVTPTPNYQAGGTGMSGHSGQHFQDVAALTYDDERITTISLRLVGRERKTRGPLKPVQHSTPIPPPV